MQPLAPRVLLVLVVLLLGGCGGAGPSDDARTATTAHAVSNTTTRPDPDPSTPDASDAGTATQVASEGLSASLYQTRLDVAAGQVEVQLTNESGAGLTVRSLSLSSSGFASPMVSALSDIVIGPGRVVDLPVPLGAAVCAAGQLEHHVQLDYEREDGTLATAVLPAQDQGGRIAQLHVTECFADEVAGVATLAIAEPPTVRELDGALVADLVLEVTPGGAPGTLELVRVHNTTLLQLLDPATGQRQPQGYGVGRVLGEPEQRGTAARPVVLTVAPARCDAHAVAEDKQGTRLRVDVVLDGREGTVAVPAPREVTAALYDFVQQACGSSS